MYSVEWEQWNIKTIHSEYWHLNWMYWLNAQPSIFISVIRSQNDYSHVVQLLFMRLDMNANAVLRERPNAYFEWISHPNAKLENQEVLRTYTSAKIFGFNRNIAYPFCFKNE